MAQVASVSELHQAALVYCRHGWSAVPVAVTGKWALVRWRVWQQARPDPDQLATWWQRWPAANVGVITGPVSGLVVLDVDPPHGGGAALAKLEATHGDLPRSAVVETPSGGWHVYLQWPGFKVANSAGRLGPGLDVRGQGGLVLAPPSRRSLGAYRWAAGGPATVPAIPAAWRELLRPRQSKPAPAAGPALLLDEGRDAARLAGLLRALQCAPEGQHNNVVYWAACRLREMLNQGAPESWVEVLIEAGIRIGTVQDASWRRAVRATVASALGRDP
jgi:hypothetical protein